MSIFGSIPSIVFFVVGVVVIASSILVVAMRNPVHSALFLLVTFLSVAILFIMGGAEFVGAVQILVYAGGIMVLFLFVIMLINMRQLHLEKMASPFWGGALVVGILVFALLGSMATSRGLHPQVVRAAALETAPGAAAPTGNSEAVSMALFTDYLVPFEVASLFLLVAMIGAIVIGKRELQSDEEDLVQSFIVERAKEEKEVKEAMSA